MDTLTEILAWAGDVIDSLAALVTDSPVTYLVIFALAALDPLLPILPAEGAVTAAAVLAGQGKLTLAWVIIAAGLGAFVGDNIAYWVGRTAGRPIIERILRGRTGQLETAEAQFRRRGGALIIIGRFVPGGRSAVAIGAGALRFQWRRFIAYDALAALIWALQAALPGYVGGVLIADRPWLALLVGFALSILLAATLAVLQRWWVRRGGGKDGQAHDSAEAAPSQSADAGG
jgi:membrane protein DedA with SNARE-associated domain